jgi:transcriptional regulator with XRE-family HTH domain
VKYLRNDDVVRKFGKRVREVRLSRKLPMEALAFEAGIEYSQLSRIERGIINTSISQIFALAKALKVKPAELLDF